MPVKPSIENAGVDVLTRLRQKILSSTPAGNAKFSLRPGGRPAGAGGRMSVLTLAPTPAARRLHVDFSRLI